MTPEAALNTLKDFAEIYISQWKQEYSSGGPEDNAYSKRIEDQIETAVAVLRRVLILKDKP